MKTNYKKLKSTVQGVAEIKKIFYKSHYGVHSIELKGIH